MKVCYGCGERIQLTGVAELPRWVDKYHSFVCESEMVHYGEGFRMISMDFHYVEGEEQKRWRLEETA